MAFPERVLTRKDTAKGRESKNKISWKASYLTLVELHIQAHRILDGFLYSGHNVDGKDEILLILEMGGF